MVRWSGVFLLVWLTAAGATASPPASLESGGTGRVVEVVDGDTVVLADGREIRLVGIQAPKLPLGRPDFTAWPLADAAKAALAMLIENTVVELGYGGRTVDRHGRLLAHLYAVDGTWIQGALLARGMARVYSFSDNRALVAEMLALERAARAARTGIWRHPYYRVLAPEETVDRVDSFQIVEGRVLDAAVVRGRGYLNFGVDWKSDFTISIGPKSRRLFEAANLNIEALAGKTVRVRGWIKSFNGPMIEATHPEQVEVDTP